MTFADWRISWIQLFLYSGSQSQTEIRNGSGSLQACYNENCFLYESRENVSWKVFNN